MLNLSTNFTKQGQLNNPTKAVIVQLYYNNNTAFMGFSTKSMVVDGVQYLGLISSFSTPKVSWQWASNNLVTTTTPAVELGNFESTLDAYSLIDEFYTKNVLGCKVKVYLGYPTFTTVSDFLQIYDGSVEDLEFADNLIKIVFKQNDLSNSEIAGRRLDFSVPTISGMTEDADGLRIPIPFGYQWNAPAVCVGPGKFWFYETSGWNSTPATWPTATSGYQGNLGFNDRVLYIEDNDYLVPIYSDGWDDANVVAYSGYQAFVNSGTSICSDWSDVTAMIPMKINPASKTAGFSSVAPTGTSISVSGTIWDVMDGAFATSARITVTNTVARPNNYINHPYIIASHNVVQPGKPMVNLLREHTGALGYVEEHLERPIHVGERSEILDTKNFLWLKCIYQQLANDVMYGSRTRRNLIGTGGAYAGQSSSTSYGDIWHTFAYGTIASGQQEYCWPRMAASDSNWGGNPLTPNGVNVFNGSWPYSGTAGDLYDGCMSSREAIEKYALEFYIRFMAFGVGTAIYEWKHFCMLHTASIPMPTTYAYLMTDGIGGWKRPNEYISGILNRVETTPSIDATSYAGFSAMWDDTRDYSGFCLTDDTTFSDFIREYVRGELWSFYKDELGKYRFVFFKDTYSSSDVAGTLKYDDCIKFSMSLSPLDAVKYKIKSLKTDRIYFNRGYAVDVSYDINDGGYSKTYYGTDSDDFELEGLEKKYTSNSGGIIVEYDFQHWRCLRESKGIVPGTDSSVWKSITSPSTGIWPEWSATTTYRPLSSEVQSIARKYLNQFGNRHRQVICVSKNSDWYKYQLGDVVVFSGVPDKLLGQAIGGFGGSTAETIALNGQTMYKYFIITSINKGLDEVEIGATQLFNLNTLTVRSL